jgi:hypothetical protein
VSPHQCIEMVATPLTRKCSDEPPRYGRCDLRVAANRQQTIVAEEPRALPQAAPQIKLTAADEDRSSDPKHR